MPNARPPARLAACAALVAASLVAAALTPVASSCPAAPPSPLRKLYADSDLVVVARVGDASVASTDEDGGALLRITLDVSKTLKGDAKERTPVFYHDVWGEDSEWREEFERGRTLLLFLKPREGTDGYSLTDYAVGMKKLSDEHLKVYVRRIEELAPIVARAQPDPAEITEWLVRCAEEPATRWEGAYELALYADVPSADKGGALPADKGGAADADKGGAADAAAHADGAQTIKVAGAQTADTGGAQAVVAGGAALPSAEGSEDDKGVADEAAGTRVIVLHTGGAAAAAVQPDGQSPAPVPESAVMRVMRLRRETNYAALLTPAQKERLAASLFSAEELGDGEMTLLHLVARWPDERLAPFALKHLRGMADKPPYEAETLMTVAARALGDKVLLKLAADYSAGVAYDDLSMPDEEYEEPAEDEEGKKAAAERRAAAAEALNWRSTRLYQFLALAQPQHKP